MAMISHLREHGPQKRPEETLEVTFSCECSFEMFDQKVQRDFNLVVNTATSTASVCTSMMHDHYKVHIDQMPKLYFILIHPRFVHKI